MPNFAIIVEGAHDASFVGQILKAEKFAVAKKLSLVPREWRILFPKAFPADGELLDRVMRFPEVFTRDDITVGITTSGSDSKLISALRVVLDAMGAAAIAGVAVFVDTDKNAVIDRFYSVRDQIIAMNAAVIKAGEPGYPITVPTSPGTMENGQPSVGVFLFPDNKQFGSLEHVLLECAHINHPDIYFAASNFVKDLDTNIPSTQHDMKALRSGMGRDKAIVGIIANLLRPGASVAVSLAQTGWLAKSALTTPSAQQTIIFLKSLFSI